MGKLERTRRGASFTSLFASAARPTLTDPRILLMVPRHDANDANLSRIADDLIGIRELLERIDHSQDALPARILTQQPGMAALRRQINDALTRLTPAEAATAHANTPATGAGHA